MIPVIRPVLVGPGVIPTWVQVQVLLQEGAGIPVTCTVRNGNLKSLMDMKFVFWCIAVVLAYRYDVNNKFQQPFSVTEKSRILPEYIID